MGLFGDVHATARLTVICDAVCHAFLCHLWFVTVKLKRRRGDAIAMFRLGYPPVAITGREGLGLKPEVCDRRFIPPQATNGSTGNFIPSMRCEHRHHITAEGI